MKVRYLLILICLSLTVFPYMSCQVKRMNREATLIVKEMSVERKVGQLLMVGLPGGNVTSEVRSIIRKYMPGGVILFGYNISQNHKLVKFIDELQKESLEMSGFPLFMSLDQEGGRVIRIIDGVTQFPGAMAMGVSDDEELVKTSARILGMQLRKIGINMNLAPVLDVNNNPRNPVINTRAFGSTPLVVSRMGVAYMVGLQGALCIAVGKHFPGHGDTSEDSHLTLPVIPYNLARLLNIELEPFVEAIRRGIDGIMTAHILYPELETSGIPATLSPFFLTELLRNRFGFEGVVITDDMEMHAISKNYDIGEAAVKAVSAGSDIILVSSHGKAIKRIHSALMRAVADGVISTERLDASVKRIMELKLRYKIMDVSKGKAFLGKAVYSEDDNELIAHAESVNRKLSRQAIYAHGFSDELMDILADKNTELYVITNNSFLRSAISALCGPRSHFIGMGNISSVLQKETAVPGDGTGVSVKKSIVLYHVYNPNEAAISQLSSRCKENNIPFCLLSTGNPFPFGDHNEIPPVIFTFSNTKVSLEELAECVSGSFRPKREINFDIGFNKKEH